MNTGSKHTNMTCNFSTLGELTGSHTFPFEFLNAEKPYESYNGINVRLRYRDFFGNILKLTNSLRYFLKFTIVRTFANIVKELDFWVYNYQLPPEINNTIKMEVGIEDCLHIEFEYNKAKWEQIVVSSMSHTQQ
jgi:vacuolar protein sorting-associated protein 26